MKSYYVKAVHFSTHNADNNCVCANVKHQLVDTAKQLNNSIEAKEAEIQKVQKDHGIIVKRGA